MAATIRKAKYGHTPLYLKAEMSRAGSPIYYSLDAPDDWDATVFQVADASHSWPKAFSLVKAWLKQQSNPSKRSSRKRVGAALKKWLAGQKKNPCNPKRKAAETYAQWRKRVLGVQSQIRKMGKRVAVAKNPSKGVTLRNMASVTIKRLPGGAVAVTGRKLAGTGRANPGFYRDYEAERGRGRWGVQVVILKSGPRYRAIEGAGWMTKREAQQAAKDRNSGR